jgi:light-regulated signal transduction histidine kinase (bacteriophytochrome)
MQQTMHILQDSHRRKRKEGATDPWADSELQRALEEVARLRQANEELQRFTAVVSHDLREPLRMVSAYARLLAERYRGRFDAEANEYLAFVTGGAEWMTQLISDLREYARAGNEQVHLVSINSQLCFESALRNLRISIAEAGATVRCYSLPPVLASPQLTQVFQNLMENSIRYRSQQTPTMQVSAERSEASFWRFSVADNGIGFEMAHADELFHPFYRIHARSADPGTGTGMGLAICRCIIHQCGGEMWAHSEPRKGSTFFFTLRESSEPLEPSDERALALTNSGSVTKERLTRRKERA